MRSMKILVVLFLFSFSLYAQNTPAPKKTAEKTEVKAEKYIDLDELRAMKANGATEKEITARYNEMIKAIDRDFHGVPVKNKKNTKEVSNKKTDNLTKDLSL